ncbi:MAG: hypothetical protein M0R03_23650 [Novosphingobium sp.]|jgi:hypothetical protein|nr:hypothetical protein [Novosphingobium sp.]
MKKFKIRYKVKVIEVREEFIFAKNEEEAIERFKSHEDEEYEVVDSYVYGDDYFEYEIMKV